MATIEVRITGRGTVHGQQANPDTDCNAVCSLCDTATDAVASVTTEPGSVYACKSCLRERLEAMTLGAWMLREDAGTLPWGKVTS